MIGIMKLRTKLKLSFLIMVILPVVLCVFAVCGIYKVQSDSMFEKYQLENQSELMNFYSPVVFMGKLTEKIVYDINYTVENTPELLEDDSYIHGLSQELEERLSYLVIEKDGRVTFNSSDINTDDISDILPEYDNKNTGHSVGAYTYIGGTCQSLVKQINFVNSHNQKCSIYIVTPLKQVIPQIKRILIQILIAVLFIIIITSLVLNYWIYRSVIKPLDRLKLATHNIMVGNMDFEMPKVADDELGDLCRDFEKMRIILKQSSEDKLKSDKEEKELIRNISHDLKTPLTAIKGYVEGILDGIADTPEKREKYLRTIANKANDMDKLIDELTIYSKLDTNRIPYSFTNINLKDYFDDCIDELSVEMESSNVELNYRYHAGSDVVIVADAEQLKRVINNIISNSVKYMVDGRKGIINIDIYDEGDYVHIIMNDNGQGISISELPHIFERFYRTDKSRNSKKGGSGIGLAIVKKIIEDHKGKIWVESVEGEGTTMHINLLKYKDNTTYCIVDKKLKSKAKY